jgi:NADP-dependent 3-hydroxy acid dehydrogenase YdfG
VSGGVQQQKTNKHAKNRELEMLLEHKSAVIYGTGGAIGGAAARAFAREGARLFLAGRTLQNSTWWPGQSPQPTWAT